MNPAANTNAGATLRVIDVATKNVRAVTTITGNEYIFAQRWSPDGERLVFEIARFDSDNWDSTVITGGAIATIRADGQGGLSYGGVCRLWQYLLGRQFRQPNSVLSTASSIIV